MHGISSIMGVLRRVRRVDFIPSGALFVAATLCAASAPAVAFADSGTISASHLPTAPRATRARTDLDAAAPLSVPLPKGSAADWARAPERTLSQFGLPCEEVLGLSAAPGGLIRLALSSPCRALQPVRLNHAGLSLDLRTDQMGTLRLDLPALRDTADIALTFADGSRIARSVEVLDLAAFHRIAVLWQGPAGLSLHAREVARTTTKTLTVWPRNPGTLRVALRGQGGSMMTVGAGDARAEFYTVPRDLGTVRLSLEGAVSADNCGRAVQATAFRSVAGQDAKRTDLRLRLPGCDRVGDYLRLKDLLPDLKIARN